MKKRVDFFIDFLIDFWKVFGKVSGGVLALKINEKCIEKMTKMLIDCCMAFRVVLAPILDQKYPRMDLKKPIKIFNAILILFSLKISSK